MKTIFYSRLNKALKDNDEAYVITVISGRFEGREIVGQKMFISKEQFYIEDESLRTLWTSVEEKVDYNKFTHKFFLENNIELFVEYIVEKPNLIICGGGHIALPLCNMAKMLDFNVTVIDNREEFANNERFSLADKVICKSFDDALNEVTFNKNTYFVIITRGHKDDRKCLEKVISNNFGYVGMIGSRGKVEFVVKSLMECGFSKEIIEKVHTPIGLRIGAQTPSEIAVSILAEIIQEKNSKVVSELEQSILDEIQNYNGQMILSNIIDKSGSTPRGIGTKMLVKEDGTFLGTIGGGSVENAVYKQALQNIKELKKDEINIYDLSNSSASTLGMVCGGTVKVIFEYIK